MILIKLFILSLHPHFHLPQWCWETTTNLPTESHLKIFLGHMDMNNSVVIAGEGDYMVMEKMQ